MQKSINEMWEQCNAAEAARNPERVLQKISFEIKACYFCGWYKKPALKSEKQRTFQEDIIYQDLMAIAGYKPEQEHREMIPRLSPDNVWAYVCKPCSNKKPAGWN